MFCDNLDNKLDVNTFLSFNEINQAITNVFIFNIEDNYHLITSLYNDYLSTNELVKANRFLKLSDKNLYIIGKYRTREILSHYLGIEPRSIVFSYNINRKPEVKGIEHNISHSGALCVLAVSPFQVGIDVEKINDAFNFRELLSSTFSEDEIEYIKSNEDLSKKRFYALWCRKESLLKATGEGLADNLNLIDTLSNSIERNGRSYYLHSFSLQDDYQLSISVTDNKEIEFWNINSLLS